MSNHAGEYFREGTYLRKGPKTSIVRVPRQNRRATASLPDQIVFPRLQSGTICRSVR